MQCCTNLNVYYRSSNNNCTVGYQKSPESVFLLALNRIISTSHDQKIMKRSSLDSPWRDASNGGLYMSLGSIDNELFAKNSKEKNTNNFPSRDARDMNRPPFNAPRQDESNKLQHMSLRPIDGETPWYFCMSKFAISGEIFIFGKKFKSHYLTVPWSENNETQLVGFVLTRRVERRSLYVARINRYQVICKYLKIIKRE